MFIDKARHVQQAGGQAIVIISALASLSVALCALMRWADKRGVEPVQLMLGDESDHADVQISSAFVSWEFEQRLQEQVSGGCVSDMTCLCTDSLQISAHNGATPQVTISFDRVVVD